MILESREKSFYYYILPCLYNKKKNVFYYFIFIEFDQFPHNNTRIFIYSQHFGIKVKKNIS